MATDTTRRCFYAFAAIIVLYMLFVQKDAQAFDTYNLIVIAAVVAFVVAYWNCSNDQSETFIANDKTVAPKVVPNDNFLEAPCHGNNCKGGSGKVTGSSGGTVNAAIKFHAEPSGSDGADDDDQLTHEDLMPKIGAHEPDFFGTDRICPKKQEWENAQVILPKVDFMDTMMPIVTNRSMNQDIRPMPPISKCNEGTGPWLLGTRTQNAVSGRGFEMTGTQNNSDSVKDVFFNDTEASQFASVN